ncbi:hypothetical protein F2Q70_00022288 [Brassica cretica]|uniref:Uncharacterized protein n=1 Tax=Brassica cretica TaxID=69181 RepID=A0A8S9GP47_BRACR|nr:hypothetical protein F2Q70_00022288 [Brassica cretica]KAF2559932.1 hypothetical protein F2Q68_00016309 [Brassica cretica]
MRSRLSSGEAADVLFSVGACLGIKIALAILRVVLSFFQSCFIGFHFTSPVWPALRHKEDRFQILVFDVVSTASHICFEDGWMDFVWWFRDHPAYSIFTCWFSRPYVSSQPLFHSGFALNVMKKASLKRSSKTSYSGNDSKRTGIRSNELNLTF